MKTTADILDAAAAVLERNGWYQGDFFEPLIDDSDGTDVPPRDCPVCGLGAIMIAAGMDPGGDGLCLDSPAWAAAKAFAAHLGRLEPDEITPANYVIHTIGEDWNDAGDRTADQVTGELRACAARMRDVSRA
jgi:hypothetical protein